MRLRFWILCLLAFGRGLSGQDVDPEIIDIPFQVYVWPGGPLATTGNDGRQNGFVRPVIQFCPEGDGEVIEVGADPRRLSAFFHYQGPNPLRFFQESTLKDGRVRRKPLASVTIPGDMERALLLFFPVQGGYEVLPIDNSTHQVKPGQSQVYNLTSRKIACLFNGQELLIEPGNSSAASLGPSDNFSILVRIASEDDKGRWKIQHEERLIVGPEDSALTLIYEKTGSRRGFRTLVLKNAVMPPEDRSMGEARTERE
ncbi:MAG: hypothetical protein ACQKBT_07970 [Puniceicoccales bacterium]